MTGMYQLTGEKHPFTFNIVADPLRELRYRWTVCEGDQILCARPVRMQPDKRPRRELLGP